MVPPIGPLRAAYDLVQCMGLGLLAAMVRCLFPMRRGKMHFWPDFLCTGAALILLQSFAACRSGAGELRWYMAVGLALGAAAGENLLAPLRAAICQILLAPFRFLRRRVLSPFWNKIKLYYTAHKKEKIHKKLSQKRTKQLQKHGPILYNSNV
ncbi:MAG: hypothetical protein LKJ90_03755 [Faecalibacterium sp.]|jgi:hypothetical protein|nr:hypothetical protein [Faecalibacterium sp.]